MLKVGDSGFLKSCSSDTYTRGNVSFTVWQTDRPTLVNKYLTLGNHIFIVTEIFPGEEYKGLKKIEYVCYFADLNVTECFTEDEEDFKYIKLINHNKIWNELNV